MRFSIFILLFKNGFPTKCQMAQFTASTQWKSITSPFFPDTLHSKTQCEWEVAAPKGKRVQFHLEVLDLLNHRTNGRCTTQQLDIIDGPRIRDRKNSIVTLCGKKLPLSDFITQSHIGRIRIVSDYYGEGIDNRFKIKFRATNSMSNFSQKSNGKMKTESGGFVTSQNAVSRDIRVNSGPEDPDKNNWGRPPKKRQLENGVVSMRDGRVQIRTGSEFTVQQPHANIKSVLRSQDENELPDPWGVVVPSDDGLELSLEPEITVLPPGWFKKTSDEEGNEIAEESDVKRLLTAIGIDADPLHILIGGLGVVMILVLACVFFSVRKLMIRKDKNKLSSFDKIEFPGSGRPEHLFGLGGIEREFQRKNEKHIDMPPDYYESEHRSQNDDLKHNYEDIESATSNKFKYVGRNGSIKRQVSFSGHEDMWEYERPPRHRNDGCPIDMAAYRPCSRHSLK